MIGNPFLAEFVCLESSVSRKGAKKRRGAKALELSSSFFFAPHLTFAPLRETN